MENTPELQKERFSKAYVMAVGAAAGFVVNPYPPDFGSIDISISAPDLSVKHSDPHLNIQAKATSIQPTDPKRLVFDLPIKNYNDLRRDNHIPLILVVAVIPQLQIEWLVHQPDSHILHCAAYWIWLNGRGPTTNTTTVRITLDRLKVFDIPSLQRIMNCLAEGRPPS